MNKALVTIVFVMVLAGAGFYLLNPTRVLAAEFGESCESDANNCEAALFCDKDKKCVECESGDQCPLGQQCAAGRCKGDQSFGYDLTIQKVRNIIIGIACWLIGVIFAVMIIALVIAGVRFFLASGNAGRVEAARKNLLWVVIGIAVIIATNIIIATIAGFLGADYSMLPLRCGTPIGCVDDKQCVENNGPGYRCVPSASEQPDIEKRQCVKAELKS